MEQSPATVVITDLDGTIEYVNPSFQALTGYTQAEAMGMNTRVLSSGLHTTAFYRELWDTVRAGRVWRRFWRASSWPRSSACTRSRSTPSSSAASTTMKSRHWPALRGSTT